MDDPAMMAAAQQAFEKLTPAQRQELQDSFGKMSPDQVAQAQRMMGSMSPAQRSQMAAMAANATPEELMQRSQQAAAMGGAPGLRGEAERLKGEGNALVRERKYTEACELYEKALSTSGLTLETKKAAHLNASLCYLHMERHDEVVRHSSAVIKSIDASSMKAYYRRGQAFIHKKLRTRAVKDLERALELCTESDRAVVAEQLSLARSMQVDTDEVEIEEVEYEAVEEVVVQSVSQPTASDAGMPTAAAMPLDPASMKQAASMMEGMSDEQLESMLKMGGAPAGIDASQMRMATKMMENMSREDMKRMTDMALKFQASGGTGASPPSAEELAKNPDMVATMTSLMKELDPVTLASMMSSSGMRVTPDQAKMMTDTISGMNEKTIARIAKVAAFVGKVAALVKRAKLYAKQNPAMALAILVLIVALVLRWKGLM